MKRVMNARQSDAFKVEVTLEKDSLVAGVPVTLTVTLQVKQEGAQYVMLEVPVPAGCSYASKPVNFSRSEVYREYFKEKTVIFSEKLPVGTYQFTVPLLPRFTGKYTLNPVKVELMYFPVVNANNAGREIWITERNTKDIRKKGMIEAMKYTEVDNSLVLSFGLGGLSAGCASFPYWGGQCSDDSWRHKMNDEILREAMFL